MIRIQGNATGIASSLFFLAAASGCGDLDNPDNVSASRGEQSGVPQTGSLNGTGQRSTTSGNYQTPQRESMAQTETAGTLDERSQPAAELVGNSDTSSAGAGKGSSSDNNADATESDSTPENSEPENSGPEDSDPNAGAPSAFDSPFPSEVSRPRIMIVGDSLSAGPGCYKKALLESLNNNGYFAFEFVGQYGDDCGGGVQHSAVSCSTSAHFTQPSFTMDNCFQGTSFPGMAPLVEQHDPDLIMLQLGVNDIWNGQSPQAVLQNYQQLIEQARAHNPAIVVVVAQIAKMRPDCSESDAITRQAENLVNAVPAWAQQMSLPSSPIFVADLWTNSDFSLTETLDCIHPNDAGALRMGGNWFEALKSILSPQ